MEFILELLLELILEGSFEAVGEKQIPLAVRILLAMVLCVIYFGLFGLVLYAAIQSSDPFFIGVAGFITLLITGGLIVVIIVKMKKRK